MIKYLGEDGLARVWNGPLEELQRRDFFSKSFGPLERPLERDERISPVDGSIEKIPPTQQEIIAKDIIDQFNLITEAQIDVASASELKSILKKMLRYSKARR